MASSAATAKKPMLNLVNSPKPPLTPSASHQPRPEPCAISMSARNPSVQQS